MKKIISVFLIALFAISLVACNNNDVYVPDFPEYEAPENSRITQSEAIKLAQEDIDVKEFIANLNWLKHYYISWGTCEAYTEGKTDSWTVYLRGNVSGYTDDYKMNYKSDESFSVIVDVSTNGIVGYPRNNFDE
ncbi:MAG: hypothetical protein IJ011_02690 [Clostridia bacterium]|nr:hypothetical protein [Clostridia bacterium]